MEVVSKTFNFKVAMASLLSLFVLLLMGSAFFVLAQGVPPTEVCNGKDDDGDGQIDEGVNCDHYLTYSLDKTINPVNVVLQDQFINPTDFQLVSIKRLLNPVSKLHDGLLFNPKRPDLHYLAYQLQTLVPFAPRAVLIENQFENKLVQVIRPNYLLAPTGKKKIGIPIDHVLNAVPDEAREKLINSIVPPIPSSANHYLCYEIEPYDVAEGVLLRDQFQQRPFEVIRAKYLCNPTTKVHDGKVSEIVDENNHLMCYEVIAHNLVNRKVITHDQFGIKLQNAIRTEEICVPTKKTIPMCIHPDDQGTAVVFDENTKYQNTGSQFVIVEPVLGTPGLSANAMLMSTPDTNIQRSGTPATGETYTFDTEMLQLDISGRTLNIPVQGQIMTAPRTPGDPIQSFDTDMTQLQGQLPPGDPDFDLLRITAGTGFGLPSPGHTTLTQLPGGNWNVDSFFDITYRIDFVGSPGGPLSGHSGSTTGTIRLINACPGS